MTLTAVFFYFYALVAVAGAMGLVVAPKPIHAFMSFFATLVAIAGLFLLLGSEFLAAMQLFVYGGAMTVLMLFALMFTGELPNGGGAARGAVKWLASLVVASFFGLLATAYFSAGWTISPAQPMDAAAIASILFSRLVVPFEIAGLALTIALIGAIVLAREDDVVLPAGTEPKAGGEA